MLIEWGSHLLLQFDHNFRLSCDKSVVRNDENCTQIHKTNFPVQDPEK